MTSHRILAAAAALAVAAAPAALAKKGGDDVAKGGPKADKVDKSKGKGKAKPKNVVLKGVVVSSDATTVTVAVAKATKHGKALVGTDALFTLSKIHVADTNGDGAIDGTDLVAGDKVVVQARIAKDAVAPYAARKVVDQTHPKPDDEDEQETGTEAAPAPVVS
jgi:hypothetical protein